VIDRIAVDKSTIHHENVWGIADEDLFTKALEIFDADHAAGKPFFAHIMTTSNHRPYTYPEGRIDIASKTGRDGAVKYADWALGDFLARAAGNPGSTTRSSSSWPTIRHRRRAKPTCRWRATAFRC
jgi:phosphoglycerol transferase MdoB-like AlkP superfamily enzyme